jgi:hypothetical protein
MRNVLVIGGLFVVAVVVGLWLLLSKDDSTAAQASPTPRTPSGSASVHAPPPVGNVNVTSGVAPRPTPAPSGDNPATYAVGDTTVTDHRGGKQQPVTDNPNPTPVEGRALPSTLTHEIAKQVQNVMNDCVASLPKEARGDRPRLEGDIVVAIKNKKMSITQSSLGLRNVTGDAVEPTKRCIESKTIGLENSAPDQADLDTYPIHISFAIP